MTTEPAVEIRDLRFRYSTVEEDTIRVPSLHIERGKVAAITGPSGAGKSTLIELMAGSIRDPYTGSLRVLGQEWKDLTNDSDRQRQVRRIGLIPQDFGLLPSWSVDQTLLQDLIDARVPETEREERVTRALASVHLLEKRTQPTGGLSGGQKQRVAIARMLARRVDLVIADEPTANLSAELVSETMDLFRELARDGGAAPGPAVVIVTHEQAVADSCDQQIILQSLVVARKEAVGTPPRPANVPRSLILVGLAGIVLVGLALIAFGNLPGTSLSVLGLPREGPAASPGSLNQTPLSAGGLVSQAAPSQSLLPQTDAPLQSAPPTASSSPNSREVANGVNLSLVGVSVLSTPTLNFRVTNQSGEDFIARLDYADVIATDDLGRRYEVICCLAGARGVSVPAGQSYDFSVPLAPPLHPLATDLTVTIADFSGNPNVTFKWRL